MLASWPHLPGFWPDTVLVRERDGVGPLLLREGDPVPRGWAGLVQRVSPSPFDPPGFAGHRAPVVLFAPGLAGTAGREERDEAAALARRHRLGGPPGLPDPGGTALDEAARGHALCFTEAAARQVLAEGGRAALARDPWTGLLPGAVPGVPRLEPHVSPWSLIDIATEMRGAGRAMAVLARIAGLPCPDALPDDMTDGLAEARAADPFRRRPLPLPEAMELLRFWRERERENRRVSACLGIARWKRTQVGALLGRDDGSAPRFAESAEGALRISRGARQRGEAGGIAVWASREKPGLRAEGLPVLALEDGFLRSRGLGARFLPGASYCLDGRGAYYDPAQPSDLEMILQRGVTDRRLLARAKALRAAIVARGIGKYHLGGEVPPIAAPAGRPVLLVPGQVQDDASVRCGGGAIQSNLALLRAVRAARPEGFILYKPHPDLEAGFRKGRIAAAELAAVADQVVPGAPLSGLFPLVDEVHTLTSLSGFEALLRGVPVVTYGRPFYAGWGLTEDRAPEGFPAGRRGVARSLEELVAAALILYPRYIDPVTLLPCPVELILERLEDPKAWKLSPLTLHRGLEGRVRRWIARLSGRR
ncbi:capsular polysaccharide export protein, LipB/KpsS family [Roseomonas gilardii]|uniref:capsular polysaccharide export protein, LipB/KpsS family n=1 Tax=Roseomonas gilardii TaxID=257708 RepID=UPI0004AF8235|nr:beta-3-deoxy-D-manno-oct-2-ulosonic acid transferase [Roseomonas gilardii]